MRKEKSAAEGEEPKRQGGKVGRGESAKDKVFLGGPPLTPLGNSPRVPRPHGQDFVYVGLI